MVMTKVRCETCDLEVTIMPGGEVLRYPDGAELACKLTPNHRPIECDAMQKAIIAAQQGNISVTSQLGHGSVFSFTLPVDRSQREAW